MTHRVVVFGNLLSSFIEEQYVPFITCNLYMYIMGLDPINHSIDALNLMAKLFCFSWNITV